MRRLIRIASWLYPAPWRQRYGTEFDALLAEVKPVARDVWDVVLGALIMQMRGWNFGKIMGGCGLAGLIVAGAIAYLVPTYYVSNAVLRMAPPTGAERISPEDARGQTQERLQLMQQEILSRDSLTRLIISPSLDLYHSERTRIPLEDIVLDMRNKIRIRPLRPVAANGSRSATAFTISYEYPNKFKAQAVVNQLVGKFIDGNVRQQPEKAKNFEVLEVLDPASLPERPSGPNRPALLLVGLVAGMLLGLIAALLLAMRKRTGLVG